MPTNAPLTELVLLDLKGSDVNPAVQGKLISRLSANVITSATGSRPTDSSLALTSLPSNLPSNDCGRSVYNESIYNEPVYNESVYNESVYHASVNNESAYRASVDNAPVYAASVKSDSVSELYSPSIDTQNSPTTSSEVTLVITIPTTFIPGTHLEQQQSLSNIPTRPVPPGGTSTADHPQDPQRPSAPGQPIINAQHNLDANEDQYGPLPEGWESGIDPLGLTYYVNRHTRSITRNRPSPNQAVDHQAQEGETITTASGSLPAGWEERRTPDGQVNHGTHSTTSVQGSLQPQTTLQLGPLPSVWEMRLTPTNRGYFIDKNTKTTTWDDPSLPPSLVANMPQWKSDFRQKLIYFRSQPAMRAQPGICQINVRRNHIFEDSYAEIMRQTPNDLKKRLVIKFEGDLGEDGLDYDRHVARFVPVQAIVPDGPHTPLENSFSCSHTTYSTPFTVFSNIRHMTNTRCRSIPPPAAIPRIATISSSSDGFWA